MSTLPKISVVTPSFNQAEYLEDTIRSVLSQDYPNLEYIVMDGGSTDGSADIIKRHVGNLTHWQSEPDGGQPSAINAGMSRATGDLVTFINSDDLLEPGSLLAVAAAHGKARSDVYYGNHFKIDHHGSRLHCVYHAPWVNWVAWRTRPYLAQPGTFITRALWNRVGGVDETLACCFDTDFWYRCLSAGARFHRIPAPLASFRLHPESKGVSERWQVRYRAEQDAIFSRYLEGTHPVSRRIARASLTLAQIGLGNYQRRLLSTVWNRHAPTLIRHWVR